jgi:hypothetical protein
MSGFIRGRAWSVRPRLLDPDFRPPRDAHPVERYLPVLDDPQHALGRHRVARVDVMALAPENHRSGHPVVLLVDPDDGVPVADIDRAPCLD